MISIAELTPVAYFVACPNCDDPLENPENNEIQWLETDIGPGKILTCPECGEQCRVPTGFSVTVEAK